MDFRFFQRIGMALACLISAASILAALEASCFAASAVEGLKPEAHYYSGPVEPTSEYRSMARRIKLIQLYRVDQGKSEKLVLTQNDLQARSLVTVDGYVSGIVALCEGEMAVSVDGQRMSPIKVGADGAMWVKNIGKLGYPDFFAPAAPRDHGFGPLKMKQAAQDPSLLAGGYTFFPEVSGDAVSPEARFSISFDANGEKMDLTVQQSGYTRLCAVAPELPLARAPIPFFYAGIPRAEYCRPSAEIDGRFSAIAKGIGAVESSFSCSLVDVVTILDAGDRHDAVTSYGRRRIWFYNNAFAREPMEELAAISEHESLHILVDLLRLTDRLEIRELFADLKGYDGLSHERLELVTSGRTPARPEGHQDEHALFFAFISEKNFLKGMKGGHPYADLEEFCTSFLHSLMYIERFGDALSRLIKRPDSPHGFLSVKEKDAIVDDYLRTLEVFAQTLAHGDTQSSLASKLATELSSRLAHAKAAVFLSRYQALGARP